jgi:signal transduction histidine kinase
MKTEIKFIILLSIFTLTFCSHYQLRASNNIEFNNDLELLDISSSLLIYEDKLAELSFKEALDKEFLQTTSVVPNLGISKSIFWVKIPITNNTNNKSLFLELSLPILDYIKFYSPKNDGKHNTIEVGDDFLFNKRKYKDPHYLFNINIPKGETKTFYLKIRSNEAVQLPIKIGSKTIIYSQLKNRDVLSGIYFGIMLVMILYNLFIYFSVKDKSYLYYVVYIAFILLTQASLQGYTFQYLWPTAPIIAKYSLILFPSLSGITGMIFMNIFLKTKEYSIRLYVISLILMIPYVISILLSLLGIFDLSQIIIQLNSGIVSIFMLVVPIIIYRKGFKPAKYFIVAWSVFLLGVFIFIFKDMEILPFNNLTRYTMQIGSGIETILLSFALAARINVYKKEKEDSQQKTVEVLKENEKIIKEQNVVLEQKVEERTIELNETLSHLKQTQSQLVDAEKMSSLGQLTAGIAHEINNPINFVSSSISPLRQDIEDLNQIIAKYEELGSSEDIQKKLIEIEELKEELDFNYLKTELTTIIDGIEDGAKRTQQIVNGLRNFSRLDEGDLKNVNINEGVDATLFLIKSKLNGIKVKKSLGKMPKIECNPGKINQVIMNLIDNTIYAIDKKETNNKNGLIEITTENDTNWVKLIIKDNGIGIPDDIKGKLFDPFFTTKDVGEGTGLGLSIVRNIIDNHKGRITVNSEINIGTEVIVKLPINNDING